MERKSVLIDVDDTINAMQVAMLRYVNEHSTRAYTYWQLTSNERESNNQDLDNLAQQYLSKPSLVVQSKPFPLALAGVRLLYEHGYQLHIVSSRKEPLHEATLSWLEKHGFSQYLTAVHHRPSSLPGHEFKVRISQRLHALSAFDDTKSVAEALAKIGIPVYLIRRPWNRELLRSVLIRPYPSFYQAAQAFLATNYDSSIS